MSEETKTVELTDEQLSGVAGGSDGSKVAGKYKVIAADGAPIRKEPQTNSQVLGNYQSGIILANLSGERRGTDGYTWFKVPAQQGKPSGYVATHLLKRIK